MSLTPDAKAPTVGKVTPTVRPLWRVCAIVQLCTRVRVFEVVLVCVFVHSHLHPPWPSSNKPPLEQGKPAMAQGDSGNWKMLLVQDGAAQSLPASSPTPKATARVQHSVCARAQ